MMKENEQEKRETLADLVAEYRNDADAMDRGELYQPTTEYLRRLLDRIEAIDSADAWRSLYSPGNAAAMREALVVLTDKVLDYLHKGLIQLPLPLENATAKARAALAAPPRQCDVGTAEEKGERCMAQFDQWRHKGDGKKLITAIMEWAQMPYEAQEGDTK